MMQALPWITAGIVGTLVGALTVWGKFLPPDWNALADSAALWMVIAYFVAAMGKKVWQSIGLATLTLAMANTVYYPLSAIVNNKHIEFGTAMVVWYAGALAGGIIFGLCAYWWRNRQGLLHYIGAGMPGAVLWAESAMMLTVPYYAQHIAAPLCGIALGLAVLLFVCLYGQHKWQAGGNKSSFMHCLLGLAAAVPITALGVIGYKVLWWALR